MAMGLHASSRGRSGRRAPMAEINVTPFVDVMLVLLIIFMVTAPLLNLGVDVKLPQVAAASVEQPRQQVVVQVGADGALSLIQKDEQGPADKIALDADELLLRVAAIRNQNPNLVVFVAGDGAVPYARVIEILQRLRTEARVEKATLLTSSPEPARK